MSHIRRLCPNRKNDDSEKFQGDATIVDERYDSAELLSHYDSEFSRMGP